MQTPLKSVYHGGTVKLTPIKGVANMCVDWFVHFIVYISV